MGFLDFLKGGNSLKKHGPRAANKRAQNPDRWQSLIVVGKIAKDEGRSEQERQDAVEALLQRFEFRIDPSITDQEEKDLALTGIVDAGPLAIEPVQGYLKSTEKIAWPVKMLQQLMSESEVVGALLEVLEGMDTDYERDPKKKVDTIAQLEDFRDDRIRPAVERFLEDVNETVRFHSVATILAQEDAEEARGALLELATKDESVRVRSVVLDAFMERDWDLGERAEDVQPMLPPGYVLDGVNVRKKK